MVVYQWNNLPFFCCWNKSPCMFSGGSCPGVPQWPLLQLRECTFGLPWWTWAAAWLLCCLQAALPVGLPAANPAGRWRHHWASGTRWPEIAWRGACGLGLVSQLKSYLCPLLMENHLLADELGPSKLDIKLGGLLEAAFRYSGSLS